MLHEPRGVAIGPDANVYVMDTAAFEVNVFTLNGTFLRTWGGFGRGAGQFSQAEGIAVDDSGYVYVSDSGNGRIQKFTAEGVFVKEWPAGGDGMRAIPRGIAVDHQGYLYIVNSEVGRVLKFTTQGEYVATFGQFPILVAANYVATDPQGNVYVTDGDHYRVVKFSPEGKVLSTWGSGGGSACPFAEVTGIAVDQQGDIFVVDEGSLLQPYPLRETCIQKFSYTSTPVRRSTWGELKVRYR